MIESDGIDELQERLDWIIGRKPAAKRMKAYRPLKVNEYNVRSLFNMGMKELLFRLCKELGYVVVKKKSGIEVIR